MWKKLGPFTVFDIETTGMSPTYDRIVEIAAVRINCDGTRLSYSSLVNPERKIPPRATAVHKITDNMVINAPTFPVAIKDFLEIAKDSTLVAHNARFDLSFLQEGLFRHGMDAWDGKTLDTLKLTKTTHPKLPSYSLQNLRSYFQLKDVENANQAHRAASDVEWTVQLLEIALLKAINISNTSLNL